MKIKRRRYRNLFLSITLSLSFYSQNIAETLAEEDSSDHDVIEEVLHEFEESQPLELNEESNHDSLNRDESELDHEAPELNHEVEYPASQESVFSDENREEKDNVVDEGASQENAPIVSSFDVLYQISSEESNQLTIPFNLRLDLPTKTLSKGKLEFTFPKKDYLTSDRENSREALEAFAAGIQVPDIEHQEHKATQVNLAGDSVEVIYDLSTIEENQATLQGEIVLDLSQWDVAAGFYPIKATISGQVLNQKNERQDFHKEQGVEIPLASFVQSEEAVEDDTNENIEEDNLESEEKRSAIQEAALSKAREHTSGKRWTEINWNLVDWASISEPVHEGRGGFE